MTLNGGWFPLTFGPVAFPFGEELPTGCRGSSVFVEWTWDGDEWKSGETWLYDPDLGILPFSPLN